MWLTALFVVALAGTHLVQFAALRRSGVRPTRKSGEPRPDTPYLNSCGGDGRIGVHERAVRHRAGVPLLVALVPVLVCVIKVPAVTPFLLPFMLPTFAGSLWYVLMSLRRPAGTLVEASD